VQLRVRRIVREVRSAFLELVPRAAHESGNRVCCRLARIPAQGRSARGVDQPVEQLDVATGPEGVEQRRESRVA
jgi:hypothetical protein